MIEKIERVDDSFVDKINELISAVNYHQKWLSEIQRDKDIQNTSVENVQPDYVTTTYPTDGHTKEYYGQNGASIVTDYPLPAGYVITIRETETKGGDNE